ncbi:hypothetical protein QWA68_014245 [Fusarium oxysporum]|nr:hypothetical protein QWA68_014245 [Fusarium oxysporum]
MMCEKRKRGGIHVSSAAASVWPGSGMIGIKESGYVSAPFNSTWTWRKGETAVTHRAKLLRTMGLVWFSCEHISWTTPAHFQLHHPVRATALSLDFQTHSNSNMISTTSDARQQTLLQSFTPPSSRAVAVSLSDNEAVLSADGKSKGDAIWISSDDDSDTEVEGDDEGQDLDHSQSCTTPTTSIADHFDAGFDVSSTNPGSQPHRGVSDEQQLVTGATSEPDIMMVDALSDERSSDDAQSTPTSPLMHTYSHITADPGDLAHTPLHDSIECASTSRDDSISRTYTPSPAKSLSPESQHEQDYGHTSCESTDAESESSEAEPRSPFGVRPPSQELSPRRRSRRRSSHAHETVQDKGIDVGTEGSGNEDDLDIPECARDEDYCPSPNQGHDSGDDSDDGQHCHKRRKAPGAPYSPARSIPTSARDSRRRKRSTRAVA